MPGASSFIILLIESLTSVYRYFSICFSVLLIDNSARAEGWLHLGSLLVRVSTFNSCLKCSFYHFCMLTSSTTTISSASLIAEELSSNCSLGQLSRPNFEWVPRYPFNNYHNLLHGDLYTKAA